MSTTTSPVTNPAGLPNLQIKLLSSSARAPTRGSEFAAGYDMYASKAITIPARGKGLVDTDVSMAVPAGTYGRIAPRSGLGLFSCPVPVLS
jgi:dUTP pyrophosphatase